MFFSLFSLSLCGTTVENPPISFGTASISHPSGKTENCASLDEVSSFLKKTGYLDSTEISHFVAKMKFSTKSSTIAHNFEMTINPYETSQRTAVKKAVLIKCVKSNGVFQTTATRVSVALPVTSQVITTTSKTFLWWEWDKQITIQWRPLTQSELNSIYSKCDTLLSPYINQLKSV